MSGEQVSGQWKEFTGRVKQKWGDITDDDVTHAEGSLDRLAGTIEQKYGEAKADVRKKLEEMQNG